MKTRNGFVSNSSTSSFLIYGAFFEEEYIVKHYGDHDGFEEAFKGSKVAVVYPCVEYDSGLYVGLSWDAIEDNETGGQFKEKIKTAIEKVIGKDVECSTHEDAGYDG